MPVGGSIGAGVVDGSTFCDAADEVWRARVDGGAGRLMSTGCTMRSGAHANTVFGTGNNPGENTDAASSAARTIVWMVTEMTTKDDRRWFTSPLDTGYERRFRVSARRDFLNTSSIIDGVSLPVFVFCLLG